MQEMLEAGMVVEHVDVRSFRLVVDEVVNGIARVVTSSGKSLFLPVEKLISVEN